ncbi:hypothetical protein COT50_02785 [candidate division WWE3 bacterium CG08_land_8_20_14_0_20_41_10]|uniref:Uncharacterized protein n=1 Tax=candidate division WWE3 bacterium CG08_land_8_20_14_0_20_41_10 TaxID=1975085 RepID=A0A2H0XBK1_UNCKA|nr:MAG: hypothetical protein COT50_02785 [candidate division WWE3 bacterium CG08_land_8_20_14_0_20_41_10]
MNFKKVFLEITKHEHSDKNPLIYLVTFPISIYYSIVIKIDEALFKGKAHLIRWVDLFWVLLIIYLLWYKFTH